MAEITGMRPLLLALACAGSFALDGIFHTDPVAGAVYPHLFYLPIVLAALWYGRLSVPVAGAIGLVHVLVWSFEPAAVFRAGMFLAVGGVAALIAGRPAAPPVQTGTRTLIPLLRSRSPERRYEAAIALGRTGDPAAVPALENALSDPDPGVRWMALEALGTIGAPALPVLTHLLGSDDIDLRWGAAVALGEIGDPAAVGPLASVLEDPDRYVRTRAALALAAIGAPALPSLADRPTVSRPSPPLSSIPTRQSGGRRPKPSAPSAETPRSHPLSGPSVMVTKTSATWRHPPLSR